MDDDIYVKIQDKSILDSEIIQETESKNPGFDINLGYNYYDVSLLASAVYNGRKELSPTGSRY